MNEKIEKERPELNLIPVKSLWLHLGIDFIGPIPHLHLLEAGTF